MKKTWVFAITLIMLFGCIVDNNQEKQLGIAQQAILTDDAGNCYCSCSCPGTGGAGAGTSVSVSSTGGGGSVSSVSMASSSSVGGFGGGASSVSSSSAVASSSSVGGAGGSPFDAGVVPNPTLIAWDDFSYPIGTNLNNQVCPVGTCGGWQTTARTAGTVCDGTQNSLGDTGPPWLLGPNANASKIVADFVTLPAGLVSVGNAVNIDDRLLQNRLFHRINTAAGSPAELAGLTGTAVNLAGHPFIEKGIVWMTFVSNEASADTSGNYCGFHFNRGLGSSSCFTSVKTNEVLIGVTNNTYNHYGFGRTTQSVNPLGPFYYDGTVLVDQTVHEYTIRYRFGASEPCSTTDSNGATSCPVCPTAAPCHIGSTLWIDAVPDVNGDPASAPNVSEKIMSNPSNIVGTQGGIDVLVLGCVGLSSTSQANNMKFSHLGIAADDATHHGAFKKSRLE